MSKKYKQLEKAECIALKQYIEWKMPDIYKSFFHIPSGGKRNLIEAINFKRMGVKPGIADYFLMISNKSYHGLWLEMKYGDNKLTENQIEFRDLAITRGYDYKIAYTCEEAIDIITHYLLDQQEEKK